jgi:hypothetical protein
MHLPDTKIGKWIAWFAAVVGISVATVNYLNIAKNKVDVINTSVIAGLLVFFVFYSILREAMTSRKEKYANINAHRHHCIHTIRDLTTYLEIVQKSPLTADKIKEMQAKTATLLTKCLDEFAILFSMITGTKCRATIKAIYQKEGKLFVYALVRDDKSKQINWKRDQKRLENDMDPIEENEDFELLYGDYGPDHQYFICNDLTVRRNYKTSSFKVYENNPPEDITVLSRLFDIFRGKDDWPLPYRSTIVWPIQQCPSPEIYVDKPHCIGFLAIDSESRGVFKRRWDWEIGAEISDGLFHALKRILQACPVKKETE